MNAVRREPDHDPGLAYLSAGWHPVPLFPRDKVEPPPGCTGRGGEDLNGPDYLAWREDARFKGGNIGLRPGEDVLGIDVDHYAEKRGGTTLERLEADLGELPATWRSSARADDPVSGIRWFLVPPGLSWGRFGPGIDTIQRGHRYGVVWPSVHKDLGTIYQWWRPDGTLADEGEIPKVVDLPELPSAWVAAFSKGPDVYSETVTVARDIVAAQEWFCSTLPGNHWNEGYVEGAPCFDMAAALKQKRGELVSGESRHDVLVGGITWFVKLGLEGHRGAYAAAALLGRSFVKEMARAPRNTGDRRLEKKAAIDEARHILRWAAGAHQGLTAGSECSCPMPTIQGPRRLLLTPASEIAPQRAKWLWAQRIAVGTLAILAGREGVGKSTLAYWIAAQVTRGLLPGEMLGTRAAVLVCATEDSWAHTIVPRLMAAEADLRLVFRVEVATSEGVGELVLPVDVDEVAAAAQSVGAALLLLDPLMSRLSASLDTHRDAEVRQALEPLTKVLAENDLSALGLMHFNKSGGDDPLNSLMASRAFGAVARSVSTVVKDPDDEADRRRFFGTPKNNLGPDGLPLLAFTVEPVVIPTADGDTAIGRVVWGDEVEESITEVLRRTLNGGDRTVTQEAAEWLADYLTQQGGQEESAKIKKAGHAAGHNEQALQRARKRLRLVTTSSGFPRRTFWEFGHDSHDMASHDTLGKTVITDMTDMTEASRASHVSHASRVGPPEGDMTGLTCRSCGEPMSFDVEGDGVHPTCPRPTGA